MAAHLFEPVPAAFCGNYRSTNAVQDWGTIVQSAHEVQRMHTEPYLDEPPRGCSQCRPPGRADPHCPMWNWAVTVQDEPHHSLAG